MMTLINFVAADFFKKECRNPRGFLPRPLLRAGKSVVPPPLPQKNSGGAHHFRFRFLDLCIRFGNIISKVCEGFNSGARLDERRKKLSCQKDLSSHIGLFCPLAPSSEVSSSKVAVFRELQNSQTTYLRWKPVLAGILRSNNTPRRQNAVWQSCR